MTITTLHAARPGSNNTAAIDFQHCPSDAEVQADRPGSSDEAPGNIDRRHDDSDLQTARPVSNNTAAIDFQHCPSDAEVQAARPNLSEQPSKPALRIGGVALENPFILAPLAGLSNWPFRRLAKEAGAALTVSEMASATALTFRGRATLKLLETDKSVEKPFCVQLFGKDPEHLARAAEVAVEYGADLIDLNLGCPARKVIHSGHGSALLKDLDLVRRILRAMVRAVRAPVTVKTRPAFAPGVGGTVFDLLPILADEGAAAVTLHGRTTSQGFAGEADWDMVARLAEKSPIPVIGSGDIVTAEQAVDRLRRYGVQAVMIGRGAKGRPWLFKQCLARWRGEPPPEITLEERLQVARRHARLLAESVGPKAPFMLRTVLMWYTKGLRGASEFRARLCREENLETQLALLDECVRRHRAETGEDFVADGG